MQPETISAQLTLLVMMGMVEGGFLSAFFCEMVQVAVEIARFWAFGFQLDGEMMNAKL